MMMWLSSQISPLTKDVEGSYECHASNSRGEASATGAIHMVDSLDDIIKKGSDFIGVADATEHRGLVDF